MEQPRHIIVERLREYSEEDAAGIGQLLPYLSEKFSGDPVDKDQLTAIIDSPDHEQLVARLRDELRIVGAATLSLIRGAAMGRKAWLEDFVTDPQSGTRGVGQALWDEMDAWCREKEAVLEFTSRPSREAAHAFYQKNGAVIRNTTVFKKEFRGE